MVQLHLLCHIQMGSISSYINITAIIILCCSNYSDYSDQLLAQIYNISHSPSYWLLLATSGCGYLLKVVRSKVDKVQIIMNKYLTMQFLFV